MEDGGIEMATNYKAIAKEIIEIVGGAENIISAAHCATRLRLIVKDKELIDDKKIEAIDIVKGCFFTAGQYQIILGTGIVNKVYEEVMKLGISGTSKMNRQLRQLRMEMHCSD